jgi:hypothetical protein
MVINTTSIPFYWFIKILNGGKILFIINIFMPIHIYIYQKNHVDFKFFYLQIFLWKNKNNLQDIIIAQMYEIVKIQMHFQSNYLIFCYIFFCRCVDLGNEFKIEIHLFSFGQSMKKKKWSNLGTFVSNKGWCEIML